MATILAFLESPIPYLINMGIVLAYLMAKKKAFKNATQHCQCYDARLGGGNLLGGAASLSFGAPSLILYHLYGLEFFWTLFLIQIIYSTFVFITIVWPKLYKQGKVRIESHAFGGLSLCGMIAALNIGPLYWLSLTPLKPVVAGVVDCITVIHHIYASFILYVLSLGRITTGWSKPVETKRH